MDRREFLMGAALSAGAAVAQQLGLEQMAEAAAATTRRGDMLYRKLGSTGEEVSILGLGGHHVGRQQEAKDSVRLIREAIDGGITFLDNSWDYNDGESEKRMGRALEGGYRKRVFLMTKFDGRDRSTAQRQIEESLRRLKTDHVDLLMFHEVIRKNDPDRFFAQSGAVQAALAARQAGKARFLGFTGHKDPSIHLHMLDLAHSHGFRLDAVLMPLNVMDAHFRSFQHQVLPRLVADGIGVLSMKPMGDGIILKSGVKPAECLRYVMSVSPGTVITGIDSKPVLEQALKTVREFRPMSEGEIAALLARTEKDARQGEYELFKTSSLFDSTAKHPEWMG